MGKIKKDQAGFSAVEALIILVVVGLLAFAGWYVWRHNHKQNTNKTTPASNTTTSTKKTDNTKDQSQAPAASYDTEKTKYIKDFDLASASFKTALVGSFFDEAKTSCMEAAKATPDTDTSTYIVFKKMVRDDFAVAQYCGTGGAAIFAKDAGQWKRVGSLAMAPACSLVDQYKISKEISATCYLDDGTSKNVTYP